MAKNLRKTRVASIVANRQTEHAWTLARQVGDPVEDDYLKGWAETANFVCVPERLLVFTRESPGVLLANKPKHQHHRFVLIIALKSAGRICVDERIFRLDAGQAFLIFPFQFHHYVSLEESSIRWIYITFEMSQADSLEYLRNHSWYFTPEFTQILDRLLEVVSSRNSTRMTRATKAQLWLTMLLHENPVQRMKPPSSSLTKSTEAAKLLERINDFISSHIDQPFKLEDMARWIGYSKGYLSHYFKEHFKISPGAYVSQQRLNRAVYLLRASSLNISGVAQACGYGSITAFSHTFRAAMRCSPRHYRIQFNKGNTGQ